MKSRSKEGRSITLADVAKEANVAPMTVSRFLNQHPNLSDGTARKVSAAIKKLGYAPNLAARMLMGHSSNAIGLIVPNLADSFFAEVAHTVQEVARERGLLVWVAASNSDQATEFALMRQMRAHRVDGILLIPTPGKGVDDSQDNPPVVTLDRPLEAGGRDVVLVENRRSSRQAVEHLLDHGHTRIACFNHDPLNFFTIRERTAGYEEAMRSRGLTPDLFASLDSSHSMQVALQESLRGPKPIQAIFTTNNLTTIHVVEALRELKVDIPNDVALIGFDDFELARLLKPALTVVRQPAAELGRQAARLLFNRLDDKGAPSPPLSLLLPTVFVVRESCGCIDGQIPR